MNQRILCRSLVISLILLVSISSLTILNVNAQTNDGLGDLPTLKIQIESPTNKTYTQTSILLNVTFHTQPNETRNSYVVYTILDERAEFTDGVLFNGTLSQTQPIWRSVPIEEIPDGNYTLRVTGFHILNWRWWITSDKEYVDFIINSMPPEITVLSPENKTYSSHNVNLTCLFNEGISKTSYCLDGNKNVTFIGDIMLDDLPVGAHELVIYAQDLSGNNGVSEKIYFSIEPFPTTIAVASIVTITLIGIALLVYIKKYKKEGA